MKLTANIKVPFNFSVFFTENVFSLQNRILADLLISAAQKEKIRVLFFIEEKICHLYPKIEEQIIEYMQSLEGNIILADKPIPLKGGERSKSFKDIYSICSLINKAALCRHSFAGIIGGGAFLDKIGFAAGIVHRGIRQLRFPTTVLAQCDSGIGVKNGVNLFGKKNYLGTFAPPWAVINDFNFLTTLSKRDWIAGAAEAFKVAIIKDRLFFDWLCENTSSIAHHQTIPMKKMIAKCAKIHLDHIAKSGDPFEFGSSRPLDFGHWAAHKLESLSNGKIRHGEAVAIGLMIDCRYAVLKGLLDENSFNRLENALCQLGFKLWNQWIEKKDSRGNFLLLNGIEDFREHLGGILHISMPCGLGKKIELNELCQETVLEAISYLRKFAK